VQVNSFRGDKVVEKVEISESGGRRERRYRGHSKKSFASRGTGDVWHDRKKQTPKKTPTQTKPRKKMTASGRGALPFGRKRETSKERKKSRKDNDGTEGQEIGIAVMERKRKINARTCQAVGRGVGSIRKDEAFSQKEKRSSGKRNKIG